MSIQSYRSIPRLARACALLILTSLPVFAPADAKRDSNLEFVPFRGVVVATERGATRTASIEIVNRDAEPFEIVGIEHSSERFTAQVEMIEPGRRYRLTVTFEGNGPDGKVAEWLHLATNREAIALPVHTEVLPRVYAFPKSVSMGKFDLSHIRGSPETARTVAQILMVYRKNTTGFEIKVTSDVPFLNIESEPGPQGDRWENTIWLDPDRVQPGEIEGTIFIETNDPEVPLLEVPVTGILLDK